MKTTKLTGFITALALGFGIISCAENKKDVLKEGEFNQCEYTSSEGTVIKYNLFVPEGIDRDREYPLVVFVHDAGALSDSTAAVLSQNGAKVWAEDPMQEKHPCFVLAPQFNTISIGEDSSVTPEVSATVALIGKLCKDFPIDTKRIYGTGQSMGCMHTIVTAINYPDLYAAMYLVAGQWEAEDCAPLADKKIWIVVSEDDQRAYPGMNEITDYLVTQGASLFKEPIDAQASAEEWAEYSREALASGANVKYTPLISGTLPEWKPNFPEGGGPGGPGRSPKPEGGQQPKEGMSGRASERPIGPGGAAAHMGTFPVAYTFTPILDWLFEQSRQPLRKE